jgi:hypothetical protein
MRSGLVAVLLLGAVLGTVQAEPLAPHRSWREEKCFRYQRDWNEALRRFGREGLSPAFVERNEAFIASGCVRRAKICPQTPRERELVDVLAIRVANESMSTTFLPFDCPD